MIVVRSARTLDNAALRAACDALAARQAPLQDLLQRFGYPPLWRRPAGFATLVRIVLEQQVSLASAEAVFRRLQAACGRVEPGRLTALGDAGLRGLGFTRQKAGYCLDLARRVEAGGFSFPAVARRDDAEARAMLLDLRGIGPWSADVYLLFALRRADIWPPGDVALARSVAETFDLADTPGDAELSRRAGAWTPWRSAAARLFWHAYLSRRGRRAFLGAGSNAPAARD